MPVGIPILVVAAIVTALYFALPRDRSQRAGYLRWTGFGLAAGSTLFFGAFLVGDTLADPGGWRAVGLIAVWAVPLAGLSVLAWYRPGWATRVLAVLAAASVGLSIWFATAPGEWRSFEDRHGPVQAIVTFTLVAVIALLGLKRATAAGVLLLVVGILPVVVSSIGSGLGMSSLVVISSMPVVSGVLYLLSARVAGRPERRIGSGSTEPPHTTADMSRDRTFGGGRPPG